MRLIPGAAALAVAVVCMQSAGVSAQPDVQPERIDGKPNLNGVWRALGTAHWNLEAHSAEAFGGFEALGAIAAIAAGQSYVVGGTIPYKPEALAQREANRAGWPAADPETKCYMPGIPRATYLPYPFQIVQGNRDILFAYEFATANRVVHMQNHRQPPVGTWMGTSNGHWDGDTLVVEVIGHNDQTWFDRAGNYHSSALRVTERYTKVDDHVMRYEATIEDPEVFTRPWQIRMPLYRNIEEDAQLQEYKCVEFAEELLYGHLTREAAESSGRGN